MWSHLQVVNYGTLEGVSRRSGNIYREKLHAVELIRPDEMLFLGLIAIHRAIMAEIELSKYIAFSG
ncbi:hypothetical protein XH80_03150 [Bradyrhizobium sp. CCBAU 45384]|nr:hypothetical protein [Bradyrhizobium sp. CCBAU 45384]